MNTWKLHPKVHKLKFVEFLYEFLRKGGQVIGVSMAPT